MMVESNSMRLVPMMCWVTAAVACSGCNQALGLDELRFDLVPETEQVKDAGAGDSQSDGSVAPEPDVSDSSPYELEYQAEWKASQGLIPSSDARAGDHFFVYDRESGVVEVHRAVDKEFDTTVNWQWSPGLSLLVHVPGARQMLIGYYAGSGIYEHIELDAKHRPLRDKTTAGDAGWTHLAVVFADEVFHKLSYDASTGRYSFSAADVWEGARVPSVGWWRADFSHIVPYRMVIDGEIGVVSTILKYHAATGYAELDRVLPGASETEQLLIGSLVPGLTVAAFPNGKQSGLLMYNPADGEVACGVLSLGENLWLDNLQSSRWRGAISTISPLIIGKDSYAITHCDKTNVAVMYGIDPLQSAVVIR
jgi:hypothetical protein